MAIVLQCKNGHQLRVKDDAWGKKVRCPECQTVVVVSEDAEVADSTPAKPHKTKDHPTAKGHGKHHHRGKAKSGLSGFTIGMIVAGTLSVLAILGTGLYVFFTLESSAQVVQKALPNDPLHQPVQNSNSAPGSTPTPQPVSPQNTPAPGVAPPVQTSTVENATTPPATPVAPATPTPPVVTNTEEPPTTATALPEATPGITPVTQSQASLPAGVHVWDAVTAVPPGRSPSERQASWVAVAPNPSTAQTFQGDCVVENGKLWFHIPQDAKAPLRIAAKDPNGPEVLIPITIHSHKGSTGTRTMHVTEVDESFARITLSNDGTPFVVCRIPYQKYWVEFQPQEHASELELGLNAEFVVVPTEFGEDACCDPAIEQSQDLPKENLIVALEKQGNSLSMLTFPTIQQAGKVTITKASGAGSEKSGVVTAISASFSGQSIFAAVLPQQNQWFSEAVSKKYSAAGQYEVKWKPPSGGIWRMAGRIQSEHKGRFRRTYYATDISPEKFVFACSQTGTLETLFGYQHRTEDPQATDVITPLGIYRETVGEAASKEVAAAYLLETEFGGTVYKANTKYRDVCNSIDDIKNKWRLEPKLIVNDSMYVPNLLKDCQVIIDRMDQRLRTYQELVDQLQELQEKLDSTTSNKDSAEYKSVSALVNQGQSQFKSLKLVTAEKVPKLSEDIVLKLQKPTKGKFPVKELDTLAERVRDVANHQEEQLKKLREMVQHLSASCGKNRDVSDAGLKVIVGDLGHQCRKVLRYRDVEE